MTDEEFIEEVDRLSKSPAIKRIFDAMEEKFARDWLESNRDQPAQRERLHNMVCAVQDLRRSFVSIATSDKVLEFNRRLAAKQSVR
jgi:predicted GTPase